jgi:hypothetical protein
MIQKSINNIFNFLGVFAVALIFAKREIGISPDDQNYLNYFLETQSCFSDSIWAFIINEPLWCAYTKLVSSYFDPEISLQITIFFTIFVLLGSLVFISRGLGLICTLGIFLLFLSSFALLQTILIQVRLGFALSFFMILYLIKPRNSFYAAVASLIHSVFIPITAIFGIYAAENFLKIKKFWRFVLAFAFALGIFIFFESIDLGRRANEYSIVTNYNIFYYTLVLFHYVPVLVYICILINKNNIFEDNFYSILEPVLLLILMSLPLSYWHEGAVRLYVIIDYFVILLIISLPKSIRFLPAVIFLFCNIVVTSWVLYTAPSDLNYVSHVLKQILNY